MGKTRKNQKSGKLSATYANQSKKLTQAYLKSFHQSRKNRKIKSAKKKIFF
jgi:hypothetical protein